MDFYIVSVVDKPDGNGNYRGYIEKRVYSLCTVMRNWRGKSFSILWFIRRFETFFFFKREFFSLRYINVIQWSNNRKRNEGTIIERGILKGKEREEINFHRNIFRIDAAVDLLRNICRGQLFFIITKSFIARRRRSLRLLFRTINHRALSRMQITATTIHLCEFFRTYLI